jgi:hypothetical protein
MRTSYLIRPAACDQTFDTHSPTPKSVASVADSDEVHAEASRRYQRIAEIMHHGMSRRWPVLKWIHTHRHEFIRRELQIYLSSAEKTRFIPG